eukprot:678006-Pelagomonas_calceolata.AAC.1
MQQGGSRRTASRLWICQNSRAVFAFVCVCVCVAAPLLLGCPQALLQLFLFKPGAEALPDSCGYLHPAWLQGLFEDPEF